MKKAVIIGGGITGLAAAYHLEQNETTPIETILIERDDRLGGKIQTERVGDFIIEASADSFLSRKHPGIDLCAALGLDTALMGRNPDHHKTFVKRNGRLHPLPAGLTGLIPTNLDALHHSSLLSPAGIERVAAERSLPPAPDDFGDESIAGFITRRLGNELYDNLIEPLLSGIYAGDGQQLSLAATFPQLRQLEQQHGSLFAGYEAAAAKSKPAVYPPFVSLPEGMGSLITALTDALHKTDIRCGTAVTRLRKAGVGYQVQVENGQTVTADAVIITTPAPVTAVLLAAIDAGLAQAHADIPYASSVTMSLAFAAADLSHELDGYGYLNPRIEGNDLLACTWTSRKWHNRAPADHLLLRFYFGRYGRQDMTQCSDDRLLQLARSELSELLGITATPLFHRIYRFPQAMPQYMLGHLDRVATINSRLARHPALFVAGAAYDGVGIPDCIRSGIAAANGVLDKLSF